MSGHRVLAGAIGVPAVVCVLGFALGACGDDDDDGSQAASTTTTGGGADELCGAVDDLDQDVDALGEVDVVDEGTNAVEARLDAIGDDLSHIRQAAPDTAPEEADAFDEALSSLDDAVTAVGNGGLTAGSAQAVVRAVASTVDTGQRYVQALDEACP